MKRPWTPKHPDGLFRSAESKALYKLERKAPDMAELLIEIVNKHDFITEYIGPTDLSDLIEKARQLLREVGYEPDNDR